MPVMPVNEPPPHENFLRAPLHSTAEYCAPVWCRTAHPPCTHLAINDALQTCSESAFFESDSSPVPRGRNTDPGPTT